MACDGLGSQVLGVGAGVADPAEALDRGHRLEQVGEQRPGPPAGVVGPRPPAWYRSSVAGRLGPEGGGEVPAVGVHVLAEQGDLDHAVVDEALDLGHELAERAADLTAAHGRDDAERAAVVAPDLDGDPGRVIDLASDRQRRREGLGPRRGRSPPDLGHRDRPLADWRSRSTARCTLWVPKTTSTCRRPLLDEVSVLLGQAAGRRRSRRPGRRVLERLEVAQGAVELVVGVLADAAGVEHDHVGVVDRRGRLACRRPRAGRRCARSRARSSGTRRCGSGTLVTSAAYGPRDRPPTSLRRDRADRVRFVITAAPRSASTRCAAWRWCTSRASSQRWCSWRWHWWLLRPIRDPPRCDAPAAGPPAGLTAGASAWGLGTSPARRGAMRISGS